MKKFKIKGLSKAVDLDIESYQIIDEVESYNLSTGNCTILFELTLINGDKTMIGIDTNINGKNYNKIIEEAEKQLLFEYEV